MARRRRSTPTPAQIWRILHATSREVRIARREIARLEAESRKRAAEAEEQRRLADEQRRQAEEQRRQAEEQRRREQAERDKEWNDRYNRLAGDADNRWGQLAEGLVHDDLLTLLRDADFDVVFVSSGLESWSQEEHVEYDLVAHGERDAVVVEVKATLRSSDVSRFTKRMDAFRRWRPDLERPRIVGALACLTTKGRAAQAAEAAGFYLIRAVGGTARIVSPQGFRPRLF